MPLHELLSQHRSDVLELTQSRIAEASPRGTEAELEELFSPFVRRRGDVSGHGLGLPITRQAIEAHGGHIHVRNDPGKGCVFVVELPT